MKLLKKLDSNKGSVCPIPHLENVEGFELNCLIRVLQLRGQKKGGVNKQALLFYVMQARENVSIGESILLGGS